MQLIWRDQDWDQPFIDAALPPLLVAFEEGVVSQMLYHAMLLDNEVGKAAEKILGSCMIHGAKSTTAEDAAARFGIELPDGIQLQMPDWMLEAAFEAWAETYGEDWFQEIAYQTRIDLIEVMTQAIQDGLSTETTARLIQQVRGPDYVKHRALNFARTETGNMLNRGHKTGIQQLQDETGIQMGMEWMSVMGTTTRATHAEADGQTVTLDGVFTIGGYECRWPSDSMLPARERCNCQCTILSTFLSEHDTGKPDDTPEPEVQTAEPPKVAPEGPPKIPNLDELEEDPSIRLGGSTGARLYKHPETGERFVVKYGSSPEHLREEFISEELYREMGVRVPDSALQEDQHGTPVKISRFIENATPLNKLKRGTKKWNEVVDKLRKEMPAHALMGNWDSVGLDLDNIMVGTDYKVWNIDTGGSLRFRAQGAPKGKLFTDNVLELWTLRNSKLNASAASIYDGDHWDQYRKSIKGLLNKRKQVLARAAELDPEIAEKLEKRFNSLERIEKQSMRLQKAGYGSIWQDESLRFDTKYAQDDLDRLMPGEMKPAIDQFGRGAQVDQNGTLWDGLRGQRDGMLAQVEAAIGDEGGNYGIVKDYLSGQAGSSWSNESKQFKGMLAKYMNLDGDALYWGQLGSKENAIDFFESTHAGNKDEERKYVRSFAGYHAALQRFLQKTKMLGNDHKLGTLALVRTDDANVLETYGLTKGNSSKNILRGPAESYSHVQQVRVYGTALTFQDVKHEHIFGHYLWERTPGMKDDLLYGDGENEVIAMAPKGTDVYYQGKAKDGIPVPSPTVWKKQKKQKKIIDHQTSGSSY